MKADFTTSSRREEKSYDSGSLSYKSRNMEEVDSVYILVDRRDNIYTAHTSCLAVDMVVHRA